MIVHWRDISITLNEEILMEYVVRFLIYSSLFLQSGPRLYFSFMFAFSSYERTEILNSFKYFTGLSSLAEKILFSQC